MVFYALFHVLGLRRLFLKISLSTGNLKDFYKQAVFYIMLTPLMLLKWKTSSNYHHGKV